MNNETNGVDRALDMERPEPGEPLDLPPSIRARFAKSEAYIPDDNLLGALRVALELRQPLLLTGEPGTGKTGVARFVARRLGLKQVLDFRVKSASKAGELFYTYDAIGRLNWTNRAERGDPSSPALGGKSKDGTKVDGLDTALKWVQFQALGRAILNASPKEDVAPYFEHMPADQQHPGEPALSVVLIDEIDKAQRDFPNDILAEIDEMSFAIPEMGSKRLSAPTDMTPVVIITSNTEKDLPDAFLRRCIFCHLEFPEKEKLEEIVLKQLNSVFDVWQEQPNDKFLSDAVSAILRLRNEGGRLQRKPGTAELLEWIVAMKAHGVVMTGELDLSSPALLQTLGTLFKTKNDLEVGRSLFLRIAESPIT